MEEGEVTAVLGPVATAAPTLSLLGLCAASLCSLGSVLPTDLPSALP